MAGTLVRDNQLQVYKDDRKRGTILQIRQRTLELRVGGGGRYQPEPRARHRVIESMVGELDEGDCYSVMRWGLIG